MSFSVSHRCVEAVRTRMADPAAGLNRWFADLHEGHGIARAWRLDWDRARSPNVVMGNIDVPAMVAESGRLKFDPIILAVFAATSNNTNREKYFTFSGDVLIQVDLYHSWGGKAPLDADSVASLIEAALYACFGEWDDAADEAAAFTGRMSVQRGPVANGGQNWLQVVTARMQFEVSARV